MNTPTKSGFRMKSTPELIKFANETREKQSKLGACHRKGFGLYMIMDAQVKAIELILKERKEAEDEVIRLASISLDY